MHSRSSIKCQLLFSIQMLVLTRGPCADRIRGRERVGVWISLSSFRTKEVCWGISWGILLEPGVVECWCWWLSWAQIRWDVGKKIVNSSFLHHFLFCSLKNETSNLDLVGSLTDKKGLDGGKSHLSFVFSEIPKGSEVNGEDQGDIWKPFSMRPVVPVGSCSSN